jgi:hypothetical protein
MRKPTPLQANLETISAKLLALVDAPICKLAPIDEDNFEHIEMLAEFCTDIDEIMRPLYERIAREAALRDGLDLAVELKFKATELADEHHVGPEFTKAEFGTLNKRMAGLR